VDAELRSFGAVSTGVQNVAAETVTYAKRSFEQGSHAAERLMAARTLDTAVQIQGENLRTTYEGLVAQVTKVDELASVTAKAAFAPMGSLVPKPVRTS